MRDEGVIVRGIRDIVALSPPLTITRSETRSIFAAVRTAVDRLWD